jgi:hypothetical protein
MSEQKEAFIYENDLKFLKINDININSPKIFFDNESYEKLEIPFLNLNGTITNHSAYSLSFNKKYTNRNK